MAENLAELQRAIKGLVVMSAPLELIYNGFLLQRSPASWEKAGYPCLKPLAAWVDDHCQRLDFFDLWLTKGPRLSYWLPSFFFPQGFMTAVKQTYSRDYAIAIDTLTVTSTVMPFDQHEVKPNLVPEDGVLIHGMFMEGARFDRKTMNMNESIPGSKIVLTGCSKPAG